MRSFQVAILAFASGVYSHGVIIKAQGAAGSVASQGFLVNTTLARNCTQISPCQQDSTLIRDAEIAMNVVNGCGRTELNGNIDIGTETENELAANRVTKVTQGSTMKVTIHQVNADGAGPYTCDLDQTSNGNTNFVPLTVSNNVPGVNGLSQASAQDFTIDVALPKQMNCIGASTGNICTVRCRNNALAGPFGGCFAVQQTDGTGRTNSTPAAVSTAITLQAVNAQVAQDQKDLPAAIAANQAAGAGNGNAGANAVAALLPSSTPAAAASTQAGSAGASGAGSNSNAGQTTQNGNGRANGNGAANTNGGANGNANANGAAKAGKNANKKRNAVEFSA